VCEQQNSRNRLDHPIHAPPHRDDGKKASDSGTRQDACACRRNVRWSPDPGCACQDTCNRLIISGSDVIDRLQNCPELRGRRPVQIQTGLRYNLQASGLVLDQSKSRYRETTFADPAPMRSFKRSQTRADSDAGMAAHRWRSTAGCSSRGLSSRQSSTNSQNFRRCPLISRVR
jgi:hypothetical protein